MALILEYVLCMCIFHRTGKSHILGKSKFINVLHVYLNIFCIPDTKLHARSTTVNTLYISALELNGEDDRIKEFYNILLNCNLYWCAS